MRRFQYMLVRRVTTESPYWHTGECFDDFTDEVILHGFIFKESKWDGSEWNIHSLIADSLQIDVQLLNDPRSALPAPVWLEGYVSFILLICTYPHALLKSLISAICLLAVSAAAYLTQKLTRDNNQLQQCVAKQHDGACSMRALSQFNGWLSTW